MSFNLEELQQIASYLHLNIPASTDAKAATNLIKSYLALEKDHTEDTIAWINDNSNQNISETQMVDYVNKAMSYIERTYPKYDDYTMYELLDMFKDEVIREIKLI